jgi:O-antigen ligase
LCVLVLLGVMVSPPLAGLGQAGLVVLLLASREFRARLARVLRQPLPVAALCFLGVVALGVAWSEAGTREALSTLWGWRKLLMLPAAMALFESPAARASALRVLVLLATLGALAAGASWLGRFSYPVPEPIPGILLRNHSTQGAVFAVAAACAAWLAAAASGRARLAWAGAGVVLVAGLMLFTPGRSGYVVVLVLTAVSVAGWAVDRGLGLWKGLVGGALLGGAMLAALLAVPASRDRIHQAFSELAGWRQQTEANAELTSMGIRVVMWGNTVPIIAARPLLGWGTGAFETAYARQVAGRTGLQGLVTRDPHNQYLAIAAEQGLLGLLAFAAVLACALRQRSPWRWKVLGLAVLAAWCTTALANSHFATFAEGTLLWLALGVTLGAAPREDPGTG